MGAGICGENDRVMNDTMLQPDRSRLADLLLDPRESLDVEVKGWLDLVGNEEHKATLAKAVLALANAGGGFVILGFTERDTGASPSSDRPSTLAGYSQDLVNAIVRNYAEPAFHCSVHHVAHPTSGVHPIIGVPGGHRVPVRAKRSGPYGQIVQQHGVYIRRPGPRSEQPLTAREWDELFARCLDSRRDELLDRIRDLLTGRTSAEPTQSEHARLESWSRDCEELWRRKVEDRPADHPSRCPHGFFTLAYSLDGTTRPSLTDLLDILRGAPKLTGWNTWWVPTRQEIAPYISDGAIECWIGDDTSADHEPRDSAHCDFWRVSPDGLAFLLRGYQEDGEHAARAGIAPGTVLDPTLPIWRVGEGLLHSLYLATTLEADAVTFAARYTGLQGRRLSQWASPLDFAWAAGVSKDDALGLSTKVDVSALEATLVEVVQSLLSPLYERFDFTKLPPEIVQRELNRLRKRD